MALIKCPECGKDVSDQAEKCPNCGHPISHSNKRLCPECGTELNQDETVCHNCGCPLQEKPTSPQQVEVAKISIGKKNRNKILFALAAIVCVAVVCVIGIQYQNKNELQEYEEYLETTVDAMLQSASIAEDCGNLIQNVWSDAIFEEYDPETAKYIGVRDDFNDALSNLFADEDFSNQISLIELEKKGVQDLMKEMTDPPEEYERVYEELEDLYTSYSNFIDLITSPTGSLSTFSEEFKTLDTEVANGLDSISLYLDR